MHCYFEAAEIDRLKPGLKAMAQYFCRYLKSVLVICTYRWVHIARTLCLLHIQGHAAAHKHVKYLKLKDYNVKGNYCVVYINIKMPTSHNE